MKKKQVDEMTNFLNRYCRKIKSLPSLDEATPDNVVFVDFKKKGLKK
jgi:hypothetical protein